MQDPSTLVLEAISALQEAVTALHELSDKIWDDDTTTAVLVHTEATLLRDNCAGMNEAYGQMHWQDFPSKRRSVAGLALQEV